MVDSHHYLWRRTNDQEDGPGIFLRPAQGTLPAYGPLTMDELTRRHGPVRPVAGADPCDRERLVVALVAARHRAVTSLAAGLRQVDLVALEASAGSTTIHGPILIAGRPAEGRPLLLLSRYVAPDLPLSRKAMPAVDLVAEIVGRWVNGPDQYVEVGRSLQRVLSRVADERGGWRKMTDSYLRRNPDVAEPLRGWGLTHSLHHQPDGPGSFAR